MATLRFLGAAGTVTGSKYLLSANERHVLVDCGLFQGPRDLKALNWSPLPIDVSELDAVVLTHAHLDHSGYLPRLVADGYRRQVCCTSGTADLLSLLLPDAGFLQEEEAQYANRKGWSRHKPAKPLFTVIEAQRALRSLRSVPYFSERTVTDGISVRFHPAGHIIGSAIVELIVEEAMGRTVIVFSGDLGRRNTPLLKDPATLAHADYVVVESTYGDRLHPAADPALALGKVVNEAVARGGMLVIPAFAVGRTQELLFMLRELEDAGAIPRLDIFVDSPMAIDATAMTMEHDEEFDPETSGLIRQGIRPLAPERLHIVRDAEQSKAINHLRGPGIIVSASGMCTGGRIKHHLKQRLPDSRNTICFVGFQAAGTKGRALRDGAEQVWIHGEPIPVKATIEAIDGFSAHADQHQLLEWLGAFAEPPRRVFVVHGEPEASRSLAERIERDLGWKVTVPARGDLATFARGSAAPHQVRS